VSTSVTRRKSSTARYRGTAAASAPPRRAHSAPIRAVVERYAIPLALLGLVGYSVGMLIYATTPRGAGVDTDAVNYLSAAGSLSRGQGFLGWDGQLLPYFPPGYPMALAVLQLLTGTGVERVAQEAGIVLFAGLVLATYALACRVIAAPAIRLLVTALVASSPILLQVYALISSETLFNFLCVAALALVCTVLASPQSSTRYRVALVLLAVVTASATLTRLAGVALVVSLGVTLLIGARPTQRLVERAGVSLGFCVLVMAPITIWDVFLHSQTGSWTFGDRPPSNSGTLDNILAGTNTLVGWISPPSEISPGSGWLTLIGVALVAVALVIATRELFRRPARRLRTIAPLLVFCVVYPGFLLLASSRVGLADAPLGDRYLSPLLAPLVAVVGVGIEVGLTHARRYGWLGRALAVAVVGAVCLSLGFSLARSARDAGQNHVAGVSGVNTADWANMGVLRVVRSLPKTEGELMLSNLPEMMTYSTSSVYQYPPDRAGGAPDGLRAQLKPHASAYLVEVAAFDDPNLYTPDELAQWFTVRVLYSAPDGQVVELSDQVASAP
jgi:hypothetical protein